MPFSPSAFYETYVPSVFYVPYVTSVFYVAYVPLFSRCFSRPQLFMRLTCLHILTRLHFFAWLLFLCALRAFVFLCAYLSFMFMLMQLTQTNELTYDAHLCYCWIQSSINIYQVFLLLFKISINFNAEENIWPLERLEYYLQQEIQGMLKSFTIRHDKKYSLEYFVESNSPICPELFCFV